MCCRWSGSASASVPKLQGSHYDPYYRGRLFLDNDLLFGASPHGVMEYLFIGGLLFFLSFGSLALPGPDPAHESDYARVLGTLAKWTWPFGLAAAIVGLVGMIVS